MPSNRIRLSTRLRRIVVASLAFALAFGQFAPAEAGVEENNELRGDVRLNPPLVGFYDYQLGSAASWSTDSDFDSAGTHTGTTAQDVADTLTLERIGPAGVTAPDPAKPWWDEDWETRTCFDITHPGTGTSVTEYPLRISYSIGSLRSAGLLQANDADLRVVSANGTLLPMWEESAATMWVQMDEILAGTSTYFCLYYNAPDPKTPAANHTEAAVFTYSAFKDVYYAVSNRFSSVGSPVDVVSYTANNQVRRDGTTTVSLANPGSRGTFGAAGTDRNSVFAVMGPISSQGSVDGFDTLLPISFAGTDFVVPTSRNTNRFSIYAPFGTAAVTISDGSAPPYASFNVPANTSFTFAGGDITGNNAAIISSTVPVLVAHYAGSQDAVAVYPATNASIYGIRSARTRVGSLSDGTVTIEDSGGSSTTYPILAGTTVVENGTDQGGSAADAVRVNGSGRIGGLQQRDGDGLESTVYLPAGELNRQYWIPGSHQYVATACPASATITLTTPGGATRSFACNGSPGKGLDSTNTSVTGGTGTLLSSSAGVFYGYYEFAPRNDEHILLGMKQGRQYTWPSPSVGGPSSQQGLLEPAGVWVSDDVDTGAGTGVFGEIDFTGAIPAGSTMEIRVATSASPSPSNFVGPDGLTTSFWTLADLPSVLDFAHDQQRFLRVQVSMTTTDRAATTPELDFVTVDYNLPLVARDAGSAALLSVVNPASSFMTTYLIRVRTDSGADGSAQLFVDGGSWANLVTGVLRLENVANGLNSTQWTESAPSPTPVGFDDLSPHSIVLDHDKTAGPNATLALRWQLNVTGPGSIFIETDVDTEISDS